VKDARRVAELFVTGNFKMAKARLTLECLENRAVPAAFAVPWPEANHLSLSFAPDTARVANQTNALSQVLDAQMARPAWQEDILRAFQTWAVESNINIGLVPDSGLPFGVLGLKQGDPRFGDIRIGAFPMAKDVIAVANPYDPFVANTWVGDVFLNSSYPFNIGGQNSAFDLGSVMLHEAGHAFGIGHSADPNSPMFEHFNNVRAGLTPADIAALQAIYGMRPADNFEGLAGNDSITTATALSLTNTAPAAIEADLTTPQDVDVYSLTVSVNTESLDIHLQVSGISLLVPRLTVTDAAGNIVDSTAAESPLNNDLEFHLDHLTAGKYFVKVESAQNDVFGVGSYSLEVAPHSTALPSAPAPIGNTPENNSGLSLDEVQLLATTPGYVEHTYYEMDNTLSLAESYRTYQVHSVDLGPGMVNVMTVAVNSESDDNTQYQITIFDQLGNKIAANTMADQTGHLAVQVPAVASDKDYYVQISSPNLGDKEADYEVVVDFDQDATQLQTIANGTIAKDEREVLRTLHVDQSQQFHFVLSGSDWSAPQETGVRMTIQNAAGQTVYTMTAADGASRGGDVFLDQGDYTIRFTRVSEDGSTPLLFQLSGTAVTDAIGPQLRDTTTQPVEIATAPPPAFYWMPYNPGNMAVGPAGDFPAIAQALSATNQNGANHMALLSTNGFFPPPPNASRFAPSLPADANTAAIWMQSNGQLPIEMPALPSSVTRTPSPNNMPLQTPALAQRDQQLLDLVFSTFDEPAKLLRRDAAWREFMEDLETGNLPEVMTECASNPRPPQVAQSSLSGYMMWAMVLGGLVANWLIVPAKTCRTKSFTSQRNQDWSSTPSD